LLGGWGPNPNPGLIALPERVKRIGSSAPACSHAWCYTDNDRPPTDTRGNAWVRFGDPVFCR